MRVACTNCGHYIETSLEEETEFMGFKPCFQYKPVFRRCLVHYCPNCGEGIGYHYKGEDCYCMSQGQPSTMSCGSVILSCCGLT